MSEKDQKTYEYLVKFFTEHPIIRAELKKQSVDDMELFKDTIKKYAGWAIASAKKQKGDDYKLIDVLRYIVYYSEITDPANKILPSQLLNMPKSLKDIN